MPHLRHSIINNSSIRFCFFKSFEGFFNVPNLHFQRQHCSAAAVKGLPLHELFSLFGRWHWLNHMTLLAAVVWVFFHHLPLAVAQVTHGPMPGPKKEIYHLVNSLPWKITMLLIGKPSIFMGHLYHGYVSHNHQQGPRVVLNHWVLEQSIAKYSKVSQNIYIALTKTDAAHLFY